MSDYKIEVKTIPAMTLAAISHTGPYEEIGKAFETLCECLANRNMIRPDTKIIGIFYDDQTLSGALSVQRQEISPMLPLSSGIL